MCRVLLVMVLSLTLTAGVGAAREPDPKDPAPPAKATPKPNEPPAAYRQTIRLWDVETGKEVKPGTRGQTPANQFPHVLDLLRQAQDLQNKTGGDSTREVVALLKKAIQLLEALDAPPGTRPLSVRIRTIAAPPQDREAELERAQAEVKAAEQRLQEAKDRLAKLQAAPKPEVFRARPQAPGTSPADRTAELEKRIDRLIQEVDAIRQEIKRAPPK